MSTDKAQELNQQISESIATLIRDTDTARQSATYTAWLSTMSRFHKYSFGNTLLIWSQKPDATRVAGFHTWKTMNRSVRKGEKGIRILAPIVRKVENSRDENEARVFGFRSVAVFDYSQTEGEPLPDLQLNATSGGDALLPLLEKITADLNIALVYKAIGDGAEGYSRGGVIEIEERLDTPARCGVLVHELAHEMLHKTNREGTTRQQRELEAESVSYAVLSHFGMAPKSGIYLALYDVTAEMLTASLHTISATARRIIELAAMDQSSTSDEILAKGGVMVGSEVQWNGKPG